MDLRVIRDPLAVEPSGVLELLTIKEGRQAMQAERLWNLAPICDYEAALLRGSVSLALGNTSTVAQAASYRLHVPYIRRWEGFV